MKKILAVAYSLSALGALPAIASSLGGCVVMKPDFDALAAKNAQNEQDLKQAHAELQQTRADLDATRQRLDNALRASADSSTDLMSSKARINDLAGRFDEMQHQIDELRKDVGQSRTEIYARLDDLKRAQQAQTPAQQPPPPITIPTDKTAHFKQLEEAHAKRDFATVRALGPDYVNRYPTDDKADEALFFVGDADLQDGRPSSALGNFNRLLKLFPHSNVLDRTLFDMGEAYLAMHDCSNAKVAFEACEKRFPKERYGVDSKARVAMITKNPPGLCAPNP